MIRRVYVWYAVNCPYCKEAELGALLANCSLPVGRKAIIMDYHSRDRRNIFLEQFKVKGGKFVPQALITADDVDKVGKRKERGFLHVISVNDFIHFKTLIKRLAGLW